MALITPAAVNGARVRVERVLWVEASPKGERSLSTACATAYLDGLRDSRPVVIERLAVWEDELPPFGREEALAKFAPILGEQRTAAQAQGWSRVEAEIERVKTFNRLVVSSPMWNWNIPYALKHWLDVICQPLLSFTLDERGRHVGVLGVGARAQLLLTRSSAYDGRHPEMTDYQQPYLEYVFELLGYELDQTFVVEPTTRWPPEERERLHETATADARQLGLAAVRAT
jgi:FMN-dependent NADH-azoreductase